MTAEVGHRLSIRPCRAGSFWELGPHGVLVDANVLYSKTLGDWLGLLYTIPEIPPFQVFWTEDVLAEAIYHLRRNHPD